ncbi:hypothetical protein EVAR_97290_1 [Eumeta japonica]|uniref:Uncharacterized protein n=1 Tax=Eumeta variegata TaxID=151549 RepID=A0A4C1XEI9_EUMVA|nr:hypothetical protein EVAR_97290_1 [Eumeta japonica]
MASEVGSERDEARRERDGGPERGGMDTHYCAGASAARAALTHLHGIFTHKPQLHGECNRAPALPAVNPVARPAAPRARAHSRSRLFVCLIICVTNRRALEELHESLCEGSARSARISTETLPAGPAPPCRGVEA